MLYFGSSEERAVIGVTDCVMPTGGALKPLPTLFERPS